MVAFLAGRGSAQELQPPAYVPAPVGYDYFGVAYSTHSGGLLFDASLPIQDGHVRANVIAFSFGHTLGVLGRTARALLVPTYEWCGFRQPGASLPVRNG